MRRMSIIMSMNDSMNDTDSDTDYEVWIIRYEWMMYHSVASMTMTEYEYD